jgi:DNA mismatch repair protein MutS2
MQGSSAALEKLEFGAIRSRLLHYAVSEPGRLLVAEMQPSSSLAYVREQLARVTELKQLVVEEGALPLDGVHPVRPALQKSGVEGSVLQPRELLQIGSLLRASRTIRSFVAKRQEPFPLLWEHAEPLHADKVLEFNIEQAIDESEAVKASASRELQSIRRSIGDRYESLKKRLQGILKSVSTQGFSQEEIITTREGRMVIPVKAEFKNQVPGFIHSASSSGATVFIEPADTLDLNNEIRSLQFQEQREVERILRALTAQVAAHRDPLLLSLELLARIDAVHARALYSIEILGMEPHIAEEGPLRLNAARHPLLLLKHGYTGTTPLDLELGGEYRTLLISGPNAGGKSVAMKCVGLLVLMAQAGLHIPAGEGTRLPLFQSVLVDIGDDQSIENDLSTFSSHLRSLRSIAEAAGEKTLVLIDEIGAGTDPAEGGALAAALLEHLTRQRAWSIATTHQGTLKAFAYGADGIQNGAMEFDQSTLTPTYRFRAGIPGSSYAIEMASRLGFSSSLIDRAREFLGVQQSRLDGLITELEASAQASRKQMEELQAETTRVDALVRQYEGKIREQAAELKETKRRALEEAREIVAGANAMIERSVREIRETGAGKETVRKLHTEVDRLKVDIQERNKTITDEPPPDTAPIGAGVRVRLKAGTDTGEVLSVSADGKQAVVVFGQVKMKVPLRDLLPASKGTPAPQRASTTTAADLQKPVARELDVRGMSGEEALPLVDKFIDDAVLAGLHRVDVIHGKGTGVLRKKIAEFLAEHPRVKTFRIAEWNEGGMGATVVELGDS